MRIVSLSATAAVAAGVMLLAQNPPNGPNQPRPAQNQPRPQQAMPQMPPDAGALKRYLNLTDGQLQQMQAARQQAQRQAEEKSKALETQLREKHMALQALLDKGSQDPAAVGKAVLEVRGLEKQRHELEESVRTSSLAVLNAEQKARFKAIEDAALLPAATQDAIRLGLVPTFRGNRMGPGGGGPGMGPGPRPMMRPGQGMNRQPGPGMNGPGPQGPNGPRPQGPPQQQ